MVQKSSFTNTSNCKQFYTCFCYILSLWNKTILLIWLRVDFPFVFLRVMMDWGLITLTCWKTVIWSTSSLARPASKMASSPVLLLLHLLLCPCLPVDVFHLNPDPNTPKLLAVSPSITIAEDPRGKLPPQFSLCASFYQSLTTKAAGHKITGLKSPRMS